MHIALVAFTDNGRNVLEKLSTALLQEGHKITIYQKEGRSWVKERWQDADVIVYISATGIAVRMIAPYVKDKFTDPAVVVVDEHGKYCISLLSGHVGGGNEWTLHFCKILSATPIITTATDINNKFAVDVFAKKNNLSIESPLLAKEVSARILKGEKIPIYSEKPIEGELDNSLFLSDSSPFGIYIGVYKKSPFKETLYLVPKVLSVGVGCKRDTQLNLIQELMDSVFNNHQLQFSAINSLCSIDLKANETGLIAYCKEHSLPFNTYSSEILLQAEGEFTPSPFVKKITGVDNVCERSAVVNSNGGEKLVNKTVKQGVTVAVAMKNWSVTTCLK